MKRISLVLGLIGVIVVCFGTVYAAPATPDTDTQTSIVSLTIPNAVRLDITQANATKALNHNGDAEVDFDAGATLMPAGYPTLTVRANKSWTLSAKSSGFGAVTDGGVTYNKDVGDLMLKDAGANAYDGFKTDYKSLSTSDQTIASYARGIKGDSHPITYKIKLDWTKDIPGSYVATVTYTLATQG